MDVQHIKAWKVGGNGVPTFCVIVSVLKVEMGAGGEEEGTADMEVED